MALIFAVGIGPGSADLLTAEAREALSSADVVVGYKPYVELIRHLVDGTPVEATGMRQEVDRCRRALELSRQGLRVAVVSSGDAGVYGMAGLLIELDPFAELEVIPGITACQAAAARLGAPLMNDFCVLSLSDLLTPRKEVLRRVRAVAAADLVACLYNPTSHRRRPLFEEAVSAFLQERPRTTPVGWVKNAYREGEEVHLTTLEALSGEPVDMWCIVVVGASRTEVVQGRMVTRRGYQEKYGAAQAAGEPNVAAAELRQSEHPGGPVRPGQSGPRRETKRVYLLGGTSFSRRLAEGLEEAGYPVRLSVATELGAAQLESQPSGGVQIGRLDKRKLQAELSDWESAAVIDATHPYAVEVSRLAREVATEANLPLVRACRPAWKPQGEDELIQFFPSVEETVAALAASGEKALLTVGAKGLREFCRRGLPLAARVLPTPDSLQAAVEAGFSGEDIIAAYPPHDPAFTVACLKKARASVIVSKESGREGGLDEKLQAARLTGARLFVVGRPSETGTACHDLDQVLERLEALWREC